MKKIPAVTVKHSTEMTQGDINSHNKRNEKLRDSWKSVWSQEQVEKMFPTLTLEELQKEPGFYGKFGGTRGGEWKGPFPTREEAHDVISEIAFETTFG